MGTLNLDATTVRSALDGSGRPSGDEDDDPLGRMIDGVRVKAPELLVTWVPIVPPGDRASNARPGDAGAWTLFEHPIENRLRRLISAADRMRELAEMAAPSGILVYVRAAQQVALFAYVEAVRSADSRSNEPNKARRLYVEAPHNFGTDVPVVLYLPDGGLLVQWSRIENHFDWTGRLRKQLNAHHCVPRYSIEDRLACIGASPGLHDIAVRTIDGVWLAEWPANMPCAFVGEAPFGGRRLVLPRLGHCEGGWSDDRPAVVAWTPDGAWIWIGEDSAVGDVVSTTCAARFALPLGADAREVLLFNGACRPLLDDDYASGPAAIVHAADRWHILQPDGVYSVGGTGQVRLGFDWLAAGFSHDATRLAVMVDGGVVLVLDTDTLQIVQRLNT